MKHEEARFYGIVRELDAYREKLKVIDEMCEEKKKVITKEHRERIESWFKGERA